jgi:GNAT superfamily N-acetyltransferase
LTGGFSDVEKLSAEHQIADFDCGQPSLDEWLRQYALMNQRADAAQTYVVAEAGRVAGYYALAAGSVRPADAPSRIAKGLARHPIPVVILARLAVDRSFQGRGLGAALLRDVLVRAEAGAEIIGARALLVNAKDEAARTFYVRFDSEPSPIDRLQLFLPMKDIRAALRGRSD